MKLPERYVYKSEIGQGSGGMVVRAFDTEQGHDVAVKLLHTGPKNKELARRFKREMREMGGLCHPNIVACYDSGTFEDQDYLVMELATGGDLFDYLRQTPPPSLDTLLFIHSQVAEGLAVLHERGIIHRDLKPENVLMTSAGIPKITDLGLMRRLEGNSCVTRQGQIVGTLAFTAPEQVMSSDVTPAVDVYALGAMLFEALTDRQIFDAQTEFQWVQAHLKEIPVAPSTYRKEVPPELDRLVLRMLSKDPESRPTPKEVAEALTPTVPIPALSEEVIPFVRVACLIAEPFTCQDVRAVMECEEAEAADALQRLQANEVLQSEAGSYSFRSSHVRRQLASSMTERSRRKLLLKIAQLGSDPELMHQK